jgi:hypothetical protein
VEELYVSTDIETDGPIPGPYSMLSLGSAAYKANGTLYSTYEVNLELLPDAIPGGDKDTMDWWAKQPKEAWEACRKDPQPVVPAMRAYASWLEAFKDKGLNPVFVAYPAGFDFTFVYYYLVRFSGGSPFGFQALDIKTYAAAVLGCDYKMTVKKNMPKQWFTELPKHTHVALDDAKEQGLLFLNIRRENQKRLGI